jgi:hypothetical protein
MNDWLDLKADNEYRIANGERLMNAETIKDFLVSLGFKVDEAASGNLMQCWRGYF